MEKEYVLDKNAFLVSETDENGIVLFANDDFCEISGYSRDELIGQNHNIVRHRDMPKAAFTDLWKTVKSGNVWTGFVKNSRKDGGYYWVYATVYPMFGCGHRKGGYMSCRRAATKDEIQKAQMLYKTLS